MFNAFKVFILKKFYRLLIFKTIVLDKKGASRYTKIDPFCSVEVNTDKGPFTFVFKEDKRKRRRDNYFFNINNFIIELNVPNGIVSFNKVIENKIVIVIKVMLFKPDYNVLTQVLTDLYLDNILEYIQNRNDED